MKVAIYTRVSTARQAVEGVSLAEQLRRCRLYCELHEHEIVARYCDDGASAKSLDRPAMAELIQAIPVGGIEGIVVAKLDRLTRSLRDWDWLIREVLDNVTLHSVSDSIDTSTASGRLVLNVLMSVFQWEREAIGERTRAAMDQLREQAQVCGPVPFGWRQVDDNGLEEHAGEQAVLDRIRAAVTRGQSLRGIAAALNQDKVPSARGGRWTHRSVRSVIDTSTLRTTDKGE